MTDPRTLPNTATPAEHALSWAQWADDRETDRSVEQRHVDQEFNDQEPGWAVRAEAHNIAYEVALRERDLGIAMANMWAAVAALQPVSPAGACPIAITVDMGIGRPYPAPCQYLAGHTGAHRTPPDSADGSILWTTDAPNAVDITTPYGERQ